MAGPRFIRWFRDIGLADLPLVGGKNASLGEMARELTPKGVKIPNGFAITAEAYRSVVHAGGLSEALRTILSDLDTRDLSGLAERGRQVRELLLNAPLPDDLQREIVDAYATLCTDAQPKPYLHNKCLGWAEALQTLSRRGGTFCFDGRSKGAFEGSLWPR
jgi:pyruvate,water dikinase